MKPTGFLFRVFAGCLLSGLAACAVGPNYTKPGAPNVAGYTAAPLPATTATALGANQTFVSGQDIAADWWTLFRSPELNSLISAALANSPTLAAAQETLIEAQENVRAEQGAFFPSASGSFQAERTQISSASTAGFGGATGTTGTSGTSGTTGSTAGSAQTISPYSLFNATLSVSYSPDVFGGIRRQVESLQAQADYERFELEAAYLSLTANIVTTAVSEASVNEQIASTRQIIAAEQKQLDILNTQFTDGGASKADVLNEQAKLAQTSSTLPPLQSSLAQDRNTLADLVGVFPADFHVADFTLASLSLPEDVPVSLPSALVNQRPDIQAAAAQLHSASANVGVATANMLPQITLSADAGHEALTAGTLFTPQTLLWSLVAGITQPIFEGGTLSARRKSAIAALRAAGAQYQVTVLSAFENVADALQALQYDSQTLAADQLSEQTSQQSLAVTQSQYQLGGEPFTAVLTAQTTYHDAVVERVRAEGLRLSDTAALYQALGGGWWNRNDVSTAAQTCCGIIP